MADEYSKGHGSWHNGSTVWRTSIVRSSGEGGGDGGAREGGCEGVVGRVVTSAVERAGTEWIATAHTRAQTVTYLSEGGAVDGIQLGSQPHGSCRCHRHRIGSVTCIPHACFFPIPSSRERSTNSTRARSPAKRWHRGMCVAVPQGSVGHGHSADSSRSCPHVMPWLGVGVGKLGT